ncbi:tyrosine-type recombinase/integrase [Nonomuraea sp. NPDC049725]|uniref:tyrosine-type recombinase/integrase n=1 Tax=Nonomuraea sp. NPDC049725 TaxID=3154508 RepID=UPI003431C5F8
MRCGGAELRRADFTRVWAAALKKAKLSGFHFHDLRHTGNTFAAQSGATLRDLMTRLGYSSTRAALIYQRTAVERDRAIADALGKLAEEALKPEERDRARKIGNGGRNDQSQVGNPSLTWLFVRRAGDGNRTRAVSLGIAPITVTVRLDAWPEPIKLLP